MSESTINRLAWLELDFARIDAQLSDLAAVLHQSAGDAPVCGGAALDVTRARYALRAVLRQIDEPLTEAVQRQQPAPF